jgi:WD40 repeat protein
MHKLNLFYVLTLCAFCAAQTPPINNKPIQLHDLLGVATTAEPIKNIIMAYTLDWKESAYIPHNKPIHALTFMTANNALVTGDSDGTISCWNPDQKGAYHKAQSFEPINQKTTSINIVNNRVLTLFANNTGILTYHNEQQNNQVDMKFEFNHAKLAAQTTDGHFLVTVNPQEPHICHIWFINPENQKLVPHVSVDCTDPIKALHGMHQRIIIMTEKNILEYRVVSKSAQAKKYFEPFSQPITAIAVSDYGSLVVAGLADGNIAIINQELPHSPIARFISSDYTILMPILDYFGLPINYLSGAFNCPVRSIALSPDMKYLACLGQNNSIKIFKQCNEPESLYAFDLSQVIEHPSSVNCVAFSADSKYFAVGFHDGARIWKLQDQDKLTKK